MKHFCDFKLLKKVPTILLYFLKNKYNLQENKNFIVKKYHFKHMSRSSTILPFFYNCVISVYNGKKFIDLTITKKHFWKKFGEFSFSKVTCRHNKKDKKK